MGIAASFGTNTTAQDVIGASAEETTGFLNASALTLQQSMLLPISHTVSQAFTAKLQ